MEKNFKVGLFVLVAIFIFVYMVIRISQGSLLFGKSYTLYLDVDSALGLAKNTPLQIAGVDIGYVEDISLTPTNKARLKLSVNQDIQITKNAQGVIKSTGILGDSIVDIRQAPPYNEFLKDGDALTQSTKAGDLTSITDDASVIARDVKDITAQLKKLMAGDDSTFAKSLGNIEKITDSLAKLTTKNEQNIQMVIANVQALTKNINALVELNKMQITRTLTNVESVSSKIANGEGTIGKLINDDQTVEKLNDSLDNLNNLLGGANRTQIDFGAHTEYLGGSGDFKNYLSVAVKPRPDKYFLLEVTSDPNPSFNTVIEETTVESNGVSNTFTTTKRNKRKDAFQFSAQFAKEFKNFTFRGGLIESTGGIGLDYNYGPVGLQFSAFDFASSDDRNPHLKLLANLNLTKNIYLLAGLDDFINQDQDLDWFVGFGFRIADDDIKSIFGLFTAATGGL